MSRITKFLKQTCSVQPYLTTDTLQHEFTEGALNLTLEGVDLKYEDGVLFIEDAEGYTLPTDTSKPLLNDFGEIQYKPPITCKCRREMSAQDIQTSNGSIVRSTARYFLDEKLEIRPNYLIDGCVVLTVHSYVNQLGRVEGYEVYV